ncbi:MAG: histidinol-phosphate transaminase [Clostridiales Family XIII bacterium]|jgi:histidinol-phosphate aminotransferase|nr:histidinol-phosphate transaminase [Clostridiales Family XIII bacterium]
MRRYKWESNLYHGKPYVAGEQPQDEGLVKLNTNENPYPPAPAAVKALRAFAKKSETLKLYPPTDGGALREALADYHEVDTANVFVGNGSDEVLAYAFRACFVGYDPVLFADVTYSFYPVWCQLMDIQKKFIPVKRDLHLRAMSYWRKNGGIVICNPNAPTGIGEGDEFLRDILRHNRKSVVIVDEAYADFAEFSAIPLTAQFPNLLVTRSFSKGRSLAGLRIGYAIGNERLIRALTLVKNSFNSYPVSRLAIEVGTAALSDEKYYRKTIAKVVKTREKTAEGLRKLGFDVPPSQTNFLFCDAASKERAQALFAHLREDGILVRHFDKPRIRSYLRISIGKDLDMEVLVESVKAFLLKEE